MSLEAGVSEHSRLVRSLSRCHRVGVVDTPRPELKRERGPGQTGEWIGLFVHSTSKQTDSADGENSKPKCDLRVETPQTSKPLPFPVVFPVASPVVSPVASPVVSLVASPVASPVLSPMQTSPPETGAVPDVCGTRSISPMLIKLKLSPHKQRTWRRQPRGSGLQSHAQAPVPPSIARQRGLPKPRSHSYKPKQLPCIPNTWRWDKFHETPPSPPPSAVKLISL
ncbi:MAG: hypothetical protein KVP17_003060 [Porospora cf. gigantea B]|uniref:uncharacterized protein n=1 Tax=Porospora cf. gigantea B TaxID=2853592 RepID=UPI003571B122|nr:MAG: hypothetical protein KVP17_003060 [Porospora cf. gigantea B]